MLSAATIFAQLQLHAPTFQSCGPRTSGLGADRRTRVGGDKPACAAGPMRRFERSRSSWTSRNERATATVDLAMDTVDLRRERR